MTFQATNKRNLTWENLDVAKKGKSKERNWISSDSRTKQRHKDNVIARIDKTRQNCRYKLWGNKDETINHIISECSKLAQKKYKTSHDWVGKMIYWEFSKKVKFDHANKWYMHNPKSVREKWNAQFSLGFWVTNE